MKFKKPERSEDEIRRIVLAYYYDRFWNGKSERGKKTGRAVQIMPTRRDLKQSHGLKAEEVQRALFYLMEHGLVTKVVVKKMYPLPNSQTLVERETAFYQITAEGVDRFKGPSEFTPEAVPTFRFDTFNANGSSFSINGHNRVSNHFGDAAAAVISLKEEVMKLATPHEGQKRAMLTDLDMVYSELDRPEHDPTLLNRLWQRVRQGGEALGILANVAKVATVIAPYLK